MERSLTEQKQNAIQAGLTRHAPEPQGGTPDHPLLQLQQQAGNQAVQQLLRAGAIRPKLAISQPGDPEEREADQMADHVMRSPDPASPLGNGLREVTKRHGNIHNQAATTAPPGAPRIVEEVLEQPGDPLDYSTQSFMEPLFGHDFSGVRIHTGPAASASARTLGALAYTRNDHIVFGHGQFTPNSTSGRRLLAHELAHVAQHIRTPSLTERSLLQRQPDHDGGPASPPSPPGPSVPVPNAPTAAPTLQPAPSMPQAAPQPPTPKGAVFRTVDNVQLVEDESFIRYQLEQLAIDAGSGAPRAFLSRLENDYAVDELAGDRAFKKDYETNPHDVSGGTPRPQADFDAYDQMKVAELRVLELVRNLVPMLEAEMEQFRAQFVSDIKVVVTGYLFGNRAFVMAQMQEMGLPLGPEEPMAPPTLLQQEEARRLQEAAASLARLQKAQEDARQVVVGYEPNPTAVATNPINSESSLDQPPALAVPSVLPVTFDPSSPPPLATDPDILGRLLGVGGKGVTPYNEVKAKFDAASGEIANLLNQWPALYAVSREGKSEQTAAFAQTGSPAEARSQLATAMRLLLADIEGSQTKLDSGSLDPLDLTPIEDQLLGGLPAPSGVPWTQRLPASIAKKMIEDHQFDTVLKQLGLQTAAAALFILAPFTGGASIFIALAGLAVTGVKLYLSAQQYEALAQAGKSAPVPGTELVTPNQIEQARKIQEADEVALALAVLAVGAQAAGAALGAIKAAPAAEAAIVPAAGEMESQLATAPVAGRTFTRGPYTIAIAADNQSAIVTHADYPNLLITADANGLSAFQSTPGGLRLIGQQPWLTEVGVAPGPGAGTALAPSRTLPPGLESPLGPSLGPGPSPPLQFGPGSPTTLTLRQVLNLRGQARWQAGELYVQEMYSGRGQVYRPVPLNAQGQFPVTAPGGRFTDVSAQWGARELGIEVKVYQQWRTFEGVAQSQSVPLSDPIAEQIAKDVALRALDPSFDPRWVFLDAPPSPDLARRLNQAGIVYIVHSL